MNLKHVALYTKFHYKKSDDIWADIKKCLEADTYMPRNKEDILTIIIRNVVPLFNMPTADFAMVFTDALYPYNCWKYGYYHNDCKWVKDYKKLPEYDYQTAILWFYLSKLQGATIDECGGLPQADEKVLPFSETLLESMEK